MGRRRFGENRYSREANKSRTNFGRFRSRFLRGDDEDDGDRRKSLHLEDEERTMSKKERNKVIETEDASRGPLSGVIRLADSSRVIQRLKSAGRSYSLPRQHKM